ncbi:hypothetical protein C8Q75DRAFT_809523 [Abortiporus biennis]|nr:hypothetical protein C8Q75DRAFT_809523 [Abortiporus biennis]
MAPPQALLVVFTEPGDAVPVADFEDWFENEHVHPLRTECPVFLSWTRLQAVNPTTPAWGTIYDLTSYEDTKKPEFIKLLTNRSDRENHIFANGKSFDRRVYEQYEGPVHPPSSLYDPSKPAPYTVFTSLDVKPEGVEEFNKWYDEEHIPLLAKVPGWIRTRRFLLKEQGHIGTDAKKEPKPASAPKYLAVHEWDSLKGFETEEYKAAMGTPWMAKVMPFFTAHERKVVKFYNDWVKDERTGDVYIRRLLEKKSAL